MKDERLSLLQNNYSSFLETNMQKKVRTGRANMSHLARSDRGTVRLTYLSQEQDSITSARDKTRNAWRVKIGAIFFAVLLTSVETVSGKGGELITPRRAAHVSSNCCLDVQPRMNYTDTFYLFSKTTIKRLDVWKTRGENSTNRIA